MNDGMDAGGLPLPANTPGQILRRAREAQGIDLESLAATLKVPVRKLQALEADRYEELQGATFVRALALAACRVLKLDPAVLLADLPTGFQDTLLQVDGGLNTPFREHHARGDGGGLFSHLRLVHGVGALLLLGAVAMWWVPGGLTLPNWFPAPASAAGAARPVAGDPVDPPVAAVLPGMIVADAGSGPTSSVSVQSLAPPASVSVPAAMAPQPDSLAPVTAGSAAPLIVQAREVSWVEVVDARDQVLLGRNLAPGERVPVQGVFPIRVRVGNVQGTELLLRGRAVDLTSIARDNVARLELN